jgi:site-specific DNA-methyltransferase (adenine-specific)
MNQLPRNEILAGDVLNRLVELPNDSIDCVITSPPYYQMRDYGVSGQLGLEACVEDWVTNLRAVCRQLARVLKPTGSVWLDLGDAFSRHTRYGAPPKGLLLAPERLLIALAADGWIVRNKIVWAKTNAMPTSVGDRLNLTYDIVYLLTRSPRYFFDLDAIREPVIDTTPQTRRAVQATSRSGFAPQPRAGDLVGKNPGDVWRIPAQGFTGAHFATFPPALLRRPILASCPERICTVCGTPWRRQVTLRRIGVTAPTHLGQKPLPER